MNEEANARILALTAQLKSEEKKRKKADEKLEAERKKRKKADEKFEAERKKRKKADEIKNGTHFATIDQMLTRSLVQNSPTKSEFKAVCRNNFDHTNSPFQIRSKAGAATYDPYVATYKAAKKNRPPAIEKGQERGSISTTQRKGVYQESITGDDLPPGDIAHLVPAAVDHANSYWFVAPFLFGEDVKDWSEIQCMLHGTNKKAQGKRKDKNTGIKHMISNFVFFPSQRDFFDNRACAIFLPIMDKKGLKDWNGNKYSVIMLIDACDDQTLESVAAITHFNRLNWDYDAAKCEATTREVSDAFRLFRAYTRAVIFAQTRLKPENVKFKPKGPQNVTGFVEPQLASHRCRVRKINFCSNTETGGHPAPDPSLMLAKSVAVWSKRNGQELTAAGEPQEDLYGEYGPTIAAYMDWREEANRAQMEMDIVGTEIVF